MIDELKSDQERQLVFDGIQEFARVLCQLVDCGAFMSREQFHDLCERKQFIAFISREYKDQIELQILNEDHPIFKRVTLEYLDEALARHANVTTMEAFGLKNNALLLGINLCFVIFETELLLKK